MSDKQKLEALLDRLADQQRSLVESAAELPLLPSDNTLRKIADLELAIAAVEHVLGDSDG